jgi:hypothetical protein
VLGGITPISTVLGAAPDPRADSATLKSFARACCEAGLYLLLVQPYSKIPDDVRSAVQRRKDDQAAQQAAREAGRADWDRVKAKAGVYLASNDPKVLARYIDAYRKRYESDYDDNCPINFAVAVGPSKLLVVDCDTEEQVHAFLRDSGAPLDTPPTVKSPGQVNGDGTWAHSNGGHFYFTVSEPLPQHTGSVTMPGDYVLLWADRYVLIPPSVREEGPYRLVGQDHPAPQWLVDKVIEVTSAKASRIAQGANSELATAVDTWAASTEWDDLLSGAGWSRTARPDNCGCDIWTAPGDHGSPKSATAHDTGCTLGRYTVENAPLHIWTDNPGPELEAWMASHGSKTLSRLQVAAALEYGGNIGDAMRALNVVPDDSGVLGFTADLSSEIGVSAANLSAPIELPTPKPPQEDHEPCPFVDAGAETPATADLFGHPTNEEEASADLFGSPVPEPTEDADTDDDAHIPGVPKIQAFAAWRDLPPPEFMIEGLIENNAFTAVVGPPGVGKSGVVLDMCAAIVTGRRWMGRKTMRQRVLYLPGEGLSGAVQRLLAWEDAHGADLGEDLFLGNSVIQVAASPEAWAAVMQQIIDLEIGQLVIDTFARASVGLEENSASDVGKAIQRFDRVREATGIGLMVVHHTNKAGGTRGSSALNGALDTELMVTPGDWYQPMTVEEMMDGRPLALHVTKQKNAPEPEGGIPMFALNHGNSFVMTGPSGLVDDPLDSVVAPRVVVPETVVSIAARVKEFVERFPTQGATRGEIAYGVDMDEATTRRRDAKTAWRMRINEAVDVALRYEMIQTLTGSATGARYIPGHMTPELAKQRWAEDTVS